MRAVIPKKRVYTIKDAILFIAIFVGHYFFFLTYIAIIMSLRLLFHGKTYILEFIPEHGVMIYPVFVAPAINATIHIYYAEKGGSWVRFIMWLHTLFNFILVPLVALVI